MKNPLLVPELRELIETGNDSALRAFCEATHPAVIADLVSALQPREAWFVLRHAPLPLRAEIFSHLDENLQVELIAILGRNEIALIVTDMSPDDRADLFRRIPDDLSEMILPALARAEREDIRRLCAYEEGTAGAVMTSDYVILSPKITAAQAIERIRREAPNTETIYYAYIADSSRKLLGIISLKDLILAKPDTLVGTIMHPEVIYGNVDDDQEEVARKIQKYDLIALPVVNGGDALVGLVTHDDAIDIITREHTEDMEKFMAIAGSHEAVTYIRVSAWRHFKNRVLWVVILAVIGFVSGFIVQKFEGLLLQFAILSAFMPMLADTGGNTGSQSATLVIRALALKEISPGDILKVITKEAQVAVLLGLLLAIIAFGRVLLFGDAFAMPHGFSLWMLGIAIATALGLQVVTATLIGAVLPLTAARFKLDPAVVASPALTTIVDVTGLLIFFITVKIMLGL